MDLTNNATLLGIATLVLSLTGVGLILGQSSTTTMVGILFVIGSAIVFIADVQYLLDVPEERATN